MLSLTGVILRALCSVILQHATMLQCHLGEGGHGKVMHIHMSGLGDVALKSLSTHDAHSLRELDAVRHCLYYSIV